MDRGVNHVRKRSRYRFAHFQQNPLDGKHYLTNLSLPVDTWKDFTMTENHGVGGSIPPLGTI